MMPNTPLLHKGYINRTPLILFTCRRIISLTLVDNQRGSMDKQRLQQIEEYILGFFQRRQHSRILAKDLFDSTIEYANGDLVRALEDLEKKHRLLVRYTHEGNDYLSLTPQGAIYVGLEPSDIENQPPVLPHPPKSATKNV
ncbi:MAG TPA: hypothetical protein VFT08_10095 [Pyrinomonadaceae bacterium]|nr:hypothetical protein [Pyrinomonadaceae bacterium]